MIDGLHQVDLFDQVIAVVQQILDLFKWPPIFFDVLQILIKGLFEGLQFIEFGIDCLLNVSECDEVVKASLKLFIDLAKCIDLALRFAHVALNQGGLVDAWAFSAVIKTRLVAPKFY